MKLQALPEAITHDIQNLMVDVFEAIATLPADGIQPKDMLIAKPFIDQASALLDTTDYFDSGNNASIVESIRLEVASQTADHEDQLMHIWLAMKKNLEKAESQEGFNARFALFVPVIAGCMDQIG